ncbi:MAG: CCA tRNA nucleotidyltransferase [Castellaniella sp.]
MSDAALEGLQVYVVGGAVRDALLGLPAGDRDWVVVGAEPADMTARGFVPVGGDFPVFLHPQTHEEYALARTERKSGRGYRGFVFHAGRDVSLEEDLARRDLTINAMARTADGALVDPLGGHDDIRRRVLRHTGPAFVEDPVRLLRLARFAARFHDFSIAPETLALAHALVASGEVDALVPERVWQELAKGLMTAHPVRMLEVLLQTGAFERVLPGLALGEGWREALDCAVQHGLPLAARFALLCRDAAAPGAVADHVRAPAACRDLARLLPRVLAMVAAPPQADDILATLMACDVLRRPGRFHMLLDAAACVHDVDKPFWQACVTAVVTVDAAAIARRHADDAGRIRAALDAARLQAIQGVLASS